MKQWIICIRIFGESTPCLKLAIPARINVRKRFGSITNYSMNYNAAASRLNLAFEQAQEYLLTKTVPPCDQDIDSCLDLLFVPKITQAFREALLGCVLARLDDLDTDARMPYVQHGEGSYSGRSLDEKVVNPLLMEQQVPASKGPFLSVFRRSVGFNEETGKGIRDRDAFTKFLYVIKQINAANPFELEELLKVLAYRFLLLRENTTIRISKLRRISHEQYRQLIHNLLETPSGGRFPMFMAEAVFHAIRESFNLNWEINTQEINVADDPSGATGDIEIKKYNCAGSRSYRESCRQTPCPHNF